MTETMLTERRLKLNWIEGRPTLSGGIKSNRLIAEAMQRRGHIVTTSFLPPTLPWPKPWRVRRFIKRLRRGIREDRFPHHLRSSAIELNQMPSRRLDPSLIPDADVTFASWWEVWEQVHDWPQSKGLKIHYVRHYEVHGGDEKRVRNAYQLDGPRVVISNWLSEIMRGFGHDEIVHVPNGVAWSQFDSSPRNKSEQPTIGMLMGHSSFKDTPTGLRAVNRLLKEFPDLRVIGFGALPLSPDLNAPGCVEYHVNPDQQTIPKLYQAADCWVIPSSAEGFGMPGIEAMASHCPIVSTRCGGPEDFVFDGENGYLVDVGDDKALAERVASVLRMGNDEWRSMSARSYEIAQRFNWDKSAEKLERALYQWLGQEECAHSHAK
jgi:glycosyltransferase involved in cell wall biosynthesis